MAASGSQYKVFISHAGTDKKTIAFPLREKLLSHGITAFVDEADMEPGTDAPQAMIDAMETVKVAVVVMSPEFVARKWPMKELMCFLRRREQTQGQPRRAPEVIPFFYRLSVSELYDEPRLDRVDENGKSLYNATRFFDRMDNREPEANIAGIKAALRELQSIMGVRNDDGVSNDTGYQMQLIRDKLLETLSETVRNAVRRTATEITLNVQTQQETIDTFQAHYDVVHDTKNLVFDFLARDQEGNASTSEAKLLEAILGDSREKNRVMAVLGISGVGKTGVLRALLEWILGDSREKSRVIAVLGIGGVGKTSVLRALSHLTSVQETFNDGIYRVTLGAQCTRRELFDALSRVVHNSGGREAARTVRQENDFRKAMQCFRAWFEGRRILLLLDDMWETKEVPAHVIYELLKPHDSGKNCTVVLTTRSSDIAQRADMCIRLEPRSALGPESREILVKYSGVALTEDDEAGNHVVAQILERCSGLPLFLAAAGKAVKAMSFRRGNEGCAAYDAYAHSLESSIQHMLDKNVDDYEQKRLSAGLMTSVDVLEAGKNDYPFPVSIGMARVHRRLSVMTKKSRVPMTMLRWLWDLKDDRQAAFVAKVLEQVGLADVDFEKRGSEYVEMLRLHDSVYEFAVGETRRKGEQRLGHETLLVGYGQNLTWNDACHEWWSTSLQADGYIHENLCRHLADAGREIELIELLLRPEWAWRTVEVRGVFGLEEDLTFGIHLLHNLQKDGIDIFSDSSLSSHGSAFEALSQSLQTLELVLEALRLSFNRLFSVSSSQELFFQLHGRLVPNVHTEHPVATSSNVQVVPTRNKASMKRIETYLKRMDGCWTKPRVRCASPFLESAGGAAIRLVDLDDAVLCMDAINDGIHLICGLENGQIVVVNALRGVAESAWQAHSKPVNAIAVARNGEYVLSASSDETAKVFDRRSGDCMTIFKGHSSEVMCVAVLDENRAVSGSVDGTAQVWSMASGKIVSPPFKGHNDVVRCLAVMPDVHHVVSGGDDNKLRLWNATTGAQVGPPFVGHVTTVSSKSVLSVAVTMNGRRIVSGSEDETVRIWCAQSHRQIGEPLKGHKYGIDCVCVSRDGKLIISASFDGICIWNAENGTQVGDPLVGHSLLELGVLFLNEENLISLCSLDGTVRVWDLHRNIVNRLQERFDLDIERVSFTADGTCAITESIPYSDDTIRIWNPKSGQQLSEPLALYAASSDSDSEETSQVASYLITAFVNTPLPPSYVSIYRGQLQVWNLQSRKCSRTFQVASAYDSIAMTSSGWQAVTGSDDGTVQVWDLTAADGNPFVLGTHSSPVRRIFLSDDGQRVISLDKEDNISLWDLETKQRLREVASKEDSWKESRAWILYAIGEPTSEVDAALQIPFEGREIVYGSGTDRKVLATMESDVRDWALSPDKSTICVGLRNGCVHFMKLEV